MFNTEHIMSANKNCKLYAQRKKFPACYLKKCILERDKLV